MPRSILVIAVVALVLAILGTVTTVVRTGAIDDPGTQAAPSGAR